MKQLGIDTVENEHIVARLVNNGRPKSERAGGIQGARVAAQEPRDHRRQPLGDFERWQSAPWRGQQQGRLAGYELLAEQQAREETNWPPQGEAVKTAQGGGCGHAGGWRLQ